MTKKEQPKVNNFQAALEKTEQALQTLRNIDVEKFNNEEKSAEVLNYFRRAAIITAFSQSKDLTAGVMYLTGKSLQTVMNSINLLSSRSTQYKQLLNSIEITLDVAHACWKVSFSLNDDAVSNSYRRFINEEFGLDIPMLSGSEKVKELDNDLVANIAMMNPVDLAAAGI